MNLRNAFHAGRMAVLGCLATPALATIVIPVGVPVGTATDTLTVYGDAVITAIIPATVSLPFTLHPGSSDQFSLAVSTTYTRDPFSVTPANAVLFAFFGPRNYPGFFLTLFGVFDPGDAYNLDVEYSAPIYSLSDDGLTATAVPVALSRISGNESYNDADPPFLGTYSIIPNVGSVPEPATWAMMLAGIGGIGLTMRRRAKITVTYA